ncbi:MAG: hypothetical protein V7607_1204 [Solirubrobacteraceae bacterium]
MTIQQIIANARDGARAGSGGAWRIERATGEDIAELWHYSTRMLRWRVTDPSDASVLDWDLGHGSVSDQGAMNRAFKVLGLPYYYSRAGGAEVSRLCECGHPSYPHREESCEVGCAGCGAQYVCKCPRPTLDGVNAADAFVMDGVAVPTGDPSGRNLCEHPDPWQDNEPGSLTFPASWAR